MTRLHDTIRQARRRHTLNRVILAAGYGLLLGLIACILLVTLDRLALSELDLTWQFYAIVAACSLLIGSAWPLLRIPEPAEIALQLDRALRLQDRIATAHAVSSSPMAAVTTGPRHDDAFAAMVRRDADKVARGIDVRSVVPLRITGIWGAVAIAAIIFIFGFYFLPAAAWGNQPSLSPEQQQHMALEAQQQREQEREELLVSIEEAVAEVGDDAAVDARTREQMEALKRLSQQLRASQGEGEEEQTEQLRDESAAVMNELSRRLAEQAQRDQLAAEKAAERFGSLETPEVPMSAEQFTEALRRGEFGRAADSLEELLGQRDEMTQQQRRQLAEHLQELSQQLDQADAQEQLELAERAAQLEQALRDQGLDQETIEQLLEGLPRSEEELTEELLNQQVDEEVARRIARELERLREQQEIAQEAQRDVQAVNDALRDAAEEFDSDVTEAEAADRPADQREGQQEPADQQPEAADPDGQQPDQPNEVEPSQEQPSQEQSGQQEPSQQQGEQEQTEQSEQQGQQQDQQQAQEETEQSQQQREAAEQQRGVEEDQTREQAAEEGEPAAQSSEEPGESGETADPEAGAGGEPGEDAQGTGNDSNSDQIGQQQQERTPGDALRELEQRRESAEQRRQSSKRMRERARGMSQGQDTQSDSTVLDEQSELVPAPGTSDRPGNSSPGRTEDSPATDPLVAETEDIDVRHPDDDPGEVIAEWLDGNSQREGPPQSRRVETEQRVRQAQEVAERAVNDSAVPNRYHQRIRRYFNRLNETVDRATSGAGQDNPQP